MSQINVNPSSSGDSSGSALINMVTVVIVLIVLAVIAWWLFTAGPFGAGTRNVDVNVNVPKTEQPAPPAQQPPAQPAKP